MREFGQLVALKVKPSGVIGKENEKKGATGPLNLLKYNEKVGELYIWTCSLK